MDFWASQRLAVADGSRCGGSVASRRVCKPDPQLFGAFVRALGTRYPTVKLWSIWNEPNLRSWLSPQYEVVGSQAVQRSANLYRALATSAISGSLRLHTVLSRNSMGRLLMRSMLYFLTRKTCGLSSVLT